jgi:hypothetical protein
MLTVISNFELNFTTITLAKGSRLDIDTRHAEIHWRLISLRHSRCSWAGRQLSGNIQNNKRTLFCVRFNVVRLILAKRRMLRGITYRQMLTLVLMSAARFRFKRGTLFQDATQELESELL